MTHRIIATGLWLMVSVVMIHNPMAGAQDGVEWSVGSPDLTIKIVDSDNFKPDGTPIKDRWGVPIYEVSVSSRDGGYSVKWDFPRLTQGTNEINCDLSGDRQLPEPGVYDIEIVVWNRGIEGGQIVAKRSPGSYKMTVHYVIPEIPLVTPNNLLDSLVEVIENETNF